MHTLAKKRISFFSVLLFLLTFFFIYDDLDVKHDHILIYLDDENLKSKEIFVLCSGIALNHIQMIEKDE
jgi:hypothetical protein